MSAPLYFDDLPLGWRARHVRTVSEADLAAAVRLTQDHNGYHVDDAFARAAGFRGVITPGLLQASLFTKLGGDLDFLARDFRFSFLRPVYPGDTLTAEMWVTAIEMRRRRVTFAGTVTNQDGAVVVAARVTGHLPQPDWERPTKPAPAG